MAKKTKTLFFLLAIAFGLLIYLILSSKLVTIKQTKESDNAVSKDSPVKISMEKMEEDYKGQIKFIFDDFQKLKDDLSSATTTVATSTEATSTVITASIDGSVLIDSIDKIENDLVGLRVPEKYKKFHLDLVATLSKMKESIQTNADWIKNSQDLIGKIKNFSWIDG